MSHKYYVGLDGLRGLAVAIVLLGHVHPPFLHSGGVGVDIFFTLSGFLITSILLAEYDRHGSISYKNFYARRFLRLIPCLWLAVAGTFVIEFFVRQSNPAGLVRNSTYALLYLTNWVRAFGYSEVAPLAHTWSLAIEEQYYLLWPLFVTLLVRYGRSRRYQCWLLVFAAVAVALYRTSVVDTFAPTRIYFGLDTHSDGLLLGSALACFVSNLPESRLPAFTSKFIGYFLSPMALLSLAVIAGHWTWKDAPMILFGYGLVVICSVVVILDVVAGSHSVLRRPLSIKPLVWLGQISYGLYLWHYPIYRAIHEIDIIWGWKRTLIVGAPLSILVAAISYYTVERRFLLLKARFARVKPIEPPRSEGHPAELALSANA